MASSPEVARQFAEAEVRRLTRELAAARAEIEQLRLVCAEVYQFAGTVGAPVRVLDKLWAAAEGETAEQRE